MAILTALFATILLAGLGMSLVLLGSAETMLSGRDRDAAAVAHAARGAAAIAAADLRALPAWDGVISAGATLGVCATPGSFVDDTLTPLSPWGGATLDLRARTARLQAETSAAIPPGRPVPVWRLFEYGPISRLIPAGARHPPFYVVVWAADGAGVLLVRAAVLGPGEAFGAIQVAVRRAGAGAPLEFVAFRPQP